MSEGQEAKLIKMRIYFVYNVSKTKISIGGEFYRKAIKKFFFL